MKPLIGITVVAEPEPDNPRSGGVLKLNYNYAQFVADAGGIPILIPPQGDPKLMAEMLDGWLIPGGLDIDAKEFGQENHPKAEVMPPERFQIEKELYQNANADMPILGICYGCQFLNVMRGGNLIQHLHDVVETGETHVPGDIQEYKVNPGTKLGQLVGTEATGRSFHHQAVDQVGQDLIVTAHASDGVVEAIEDPNKDFFLAVQWHPERTPESETSRNLIQAFINAAASYKAKKQTAVLK